MKKFVLFFISMFLILGTVDIAAKKAPAKGKRKTSSATLAVTKGETKSYGDYLTTQVFSVKKGMSNVIKVEYPISGDSKMVNTIRKHIKELLDDKFAGSLETPDALLRSAIKGYRDVNFGQEGEQIEQEISLNYVTPKEVTIFNEGYVYMGGAHGMPWEVGQTILIDNGQIFDESMLPAFSKMKPYIIKGLCKYFQCTESGLSNELFDSPNNLEYPSTVFITGEGINFIYAPYEIAPYSAGIPKAVVPATSEIINMLTPAGQKFFK